MSIKNKWHFSSAGMGPFDGFNNAAVDHFRNDNSIFREVIQNSLDNHDESGEPVIVRFEKSEIDAKILGIDSQYRQILKSAEKWTQNADKDDIKDFYEKAKEASKKAKIPVFIVSDYNTVGLYRNPTDPKSNFYRLILNPGASKQSSDGGGSHGHGQHATYARSRLRTVLFQSYVEDTIVGTDSNRLYIGKTILNSWQNQNDRMRGTGFFGNLIGDDILPAFDSDVPKVIRDLRDRTGTDVIITEPLLAGKWQFTATSQIIRHFFAAIEEKKLVVELVYSNKEVKTIDHSSLNDNVTSTQNRQVKNYLDALRQQDPKLIFEKNLGDLGIVKLKIAFHDKGNQKIVMLRKPKMRLVEYSKPILPNYSGVIIIDNDGGNRIIRNLEDPEHKKLEKSRQSELYPGKNYLDDIENFIDETLAKLNDARVDDKIRIPGLGNLLPADEDRDNDGGENADSNEMDTFQDAEQMEIDFSGKIHQHKPTVSNLIILGGTGNQGGGGGNRRKSKKKGGKGGGGKSGGTQGEGMSILNSITMRSFLKECSKGRSSYRLVLRVNEDCEGYLGLNAVGVDSITLNPEILNAEIDIDGKNSKLKILESYKLNIGSLKKGQKAIIDMQTKLSMPSTIIGCN